MNKQAEAADKRARDRSRAARQTRPAANRARRETRWSRRETRQRRARSTASPLSNITTFKSSMAKARVNLSCKVSRKVKDLSDRITQFIYAPDDGSNIRPLVVTLPKHLRGRSSRAARANKSRPAYSEAVATRLPEVRWHDHADQAIRADTSRRRQTSRTTLQPERVSLHAPLQSLQDPQGRRRRQQGICCPRHTRVRQVQPQELQRGRPQDARLRPGPHRC